MKIFELSILSVILLDEFSIFSFEETLNLSDDNLLNKFLIRSFIFSSCLYEIKISDSIGSMMDSRRLLLLLILLLILLLLLLALLIIVFVDIISLVRLKEK